MYDRFERIARKRLSQSRNIEEISLHEVLGEDELAMSLREIIEDDNCVSPFQQLLYSVQAAKRGQATFLGHPPSSHPQG